MTNKDTPYDCGLGKYCNLDSDIDFIGKSALQNKKGGLKKIYSKFISILKARKTSFFNNLPVSKKHVEIGRATSIVWSPKYSKYRFHNCIKNIKKNLNDYYVLDKVNLSY